MMRQLLAAELGDVLRDAAREHGVKGSGWEGAMLTADSPLHSLEGGPVDTEGIDPLDHVEMDRLRTVCRAPQPKVRRRPRWLRAWRRRARGHRTESPTSL
jgi:hypothetical protein